MMEREQDCRLRSLEQTEREQDRWLRSLEEIVMKLKKENAELRCMQLPVTVSVPRIKS